MTSWIPQTPPRKQTDEFFSFSHNDKAGDNSTTMTTAAVTMDRQSIRAVLTVLLCTMTSFSRHGAVSAFTPAAPGMFAVQRPQSLSHTTLTQLSEKDPKVEDAAKQGEDTSNPDDLNPFVKASWYAVEAFGKVFGSVNTPSTESTVSSLSGDEPLDLTKPPSSMTETFDRIKLDNDRSYFLSGEVDKLIYDPDCVFADPFVAFAGRDRFVDNLANLGSFITEYSARMIDYDSSSQGVKTKVRGKIGTSMVLYCCFHVFVSCCYRCCFDIVHSLTIRLCISVPVFVFE